MCEFKIIKKSNNSQIGEDIVILSYTENFELLIKDVLGVGKKLESALIMNVNTLNQTTTVIEHPLIKNFLFIINKIIDNKITKSEIENFQAKLEELKSNL